MKTDTEFILGLSAQWIQITGVIFLRQLCMARLLTNWKQIDKLISGSKNCFEFTKLVLETHAQVKD